MTRLLLITLLVLSHGTVYAEWMRVIEIDEGMTAYVDPDTIRRKGELVQMWVLFDHKTVQTVAGKSYLSSRVQEQYDCTDERTRILSITWFTSNMGTGDISFHQDDKGMWQPVPPGSGFHALWTFVCSKQ